MDVSGDRSNSRERRESTLGERIDSNKRVEDLEKDINDIKGIVYQLTEALQTLMERRSRKSNETSNQTNGEIGADRAQPISSQVRLEPFTGEKEAFDVYKNRLESYFVMTHTAENMKIHHLKLMLKGRQLEKFMSNPVARDSYDPL